jgi:calcium-dependent protein kinase
MGCGSSRTEPKAVPVEVTVPPIAPTADLPEPSVNTSGVKLSRRDFIGKKKKRIGDDYRLGKKVGEGAYGMVAIATHKTTGMQRAVKSIRRSSMSQNEKQKFLNEVSILGAADHPNIIKIVEFYQDKYFYHIVSELCEGGELFDFIVKNHFLSEKVAVDIITQVLRAV